MKRVISLIIILAMATTAILMALPAISALAVACIIGMGLAIKKKD